MRGEAIDALIAKRGVRRIDFDDWKIIGDAETNRAPEGHPRERFTRVDEMLALLC